MRCPLPLRCWAETQAAKSLAIVEEDGNNGSWLDRAGMMMRAQPH